MRQRGIASVRRVRGASFAALVGLWLAPMTGALAQSVPPSPGGAIGLGNRGWSAAEPSRAASANELEFSARAGAASDYIYRGTTLSDHGPAAGAAFETRYGALYAGTTVATVKLPTQPSAEFTFAGGVARRSQRSISILASPISPTPVRSFPARPTASIIGRRSSAGIDPSANKPASRPATLIRPTSRTAAPGVQYAAAGIGYDVPGRLLPQNLAVSFSAAAGYSWFGNQAAQLGGFPLPAYLNWQAGVTLTHRPSTLSALLRHQPVEGKLLCVYGRSECAARRPRQSRHQPGWFGFELVWRDVRSQGLVCVRISAYAVPIDIQNAAPHEDGGVTS